MNKSRNLTSFFAVRCSLSLISWEVTMGRCPVAIVGSALLLLMKQLLLASTADESGTLLRLFGDESYPGSKCSSIPVIIPCFSSSDFVIRLAFPSTQTVELVLQNNIFLNATLDIAGPEFACTILRSKEGFAFHLKTLSDKFPAVSIFKTFNVWIRDVEISIDIDPTSPRPCPTQLPLSKSRFHTSYCPAIFVYGSWGIQIVQSSVFGRLDVYKTSQAVFDSLQVTTLPDDIAVVRLSYVGDGPNLVPSLITLSNSRLEGGDTGVKLNRGAVGVTVSNNDIMNQVFAGIECGERRSKNAGDCMLNRIINNFIYAEPGYPVHSDNSAIYFSTHWLNPGNYLSCNYATGALLQCFYLDWASSGITIDGGVCINLRAGLKVNTGHSNSLTSILVIQANLPGWISCQNYFSNNCLQDPAITWEQTRLASYSSPQFQKAYPFLNNLCEKTEVEGIPCNPDDGVAPDSLVTGNCSGLPTANNLELVVVSPRKRRNKPTYLSCANLTTVPLLNRLEWITIVDLAKAGFNSVEDLDYGLEPDSPIYDAFPEFRSCPRPQNGIQPVDAAVYGHNFNVSPGRMARLIMEEMKSLFTVV